MKKSLKNYIAKCKRTLVFKAYALVYDFNHFGKLHVKVEKLERLLDARYRKIIGHDFWQDAIG